MVSRCLSFWVLILIWLAPPETTYGKYYGRGTVEHQPNAGSSYLFLVIMLVYSQLFCFPKKCILSASLKVFGSTSFQARYTWSSTWGCLPLWPSSRKQLCMCLIVHTWVIALKSRCVELSKSRSICRVWSLFNKQASAWLKSTTCYKKKLNSKVSSVLIINRLISLNHLILYF